MPSTIKVHRAAITSVLKHLHPRMTESVLLGDLISRIELERPRGTRELPKFDLDLVLRQFLKPPFTDRNGSDADIPLLTMAHKVTFLLALATGARSSEIHALSRAPGRFAIHADNTGKQTMTIHTKPGFLAKNAKPTLVSPPMVIPSLKHLVGRKEPERLLCPVRATQVYIRRTPDGPYPAGDSRVLRHPKPTMSTGKNHVALWIRSAISTAYNAAAEKPDKVHVNAHEVRAVAHSLVAYNGASLEEILRGGRWAASGSFFNHYLRDMSHSTMARTTPIVAGGVIIN